MQPVLEQLLHFATLAPSGHNTQPWQFSTDRDTVRTFDISEPEIEPIIGVVREGNIAQF